MAEVSGRLFATKEKLQDAATANGPGTPARVAGLSTVGLQVAGTFDATVDFECSIDGTTWRSWPMTPIGGGSAVVNATAAGVWRASCAGLSLIRARVADFASGSITVELLATEAAS